MGKSLRWVEELEGGRRQADPQWSVIQLAALRLSITPERLMAEAIDAECVRASQIDAVRAALQRHDVITGSCDGCSADPPPVPALYRQLTYARTGFQAGHFAQLGSEIPALLVDATRAAQHHRGDDRLATYEVLSLSEGADAVAVAADIPGDAVENLPRECRAHLLTDRAIGEIQAGLRARAVETLLEADDLAPEEVRCRPRTKAHIENLRLLGVGSAEGRLRLLADRCGLPR